MHTLENKPQKVLRLGWSRFSLRRLFVVVTLIAIGFALFEPIKLHFTALHFFNIRNTVTATRPHPKELLYNIEARDKAVVCHAGDLRMVLLGRKRIGASTSGFIPISGEQPLIGGDASITGEMYFSYSYADGKAECKVYGFSFICEGEKIEIKQQSFSSNSRTVVLIDRDNHIVKTYSP